MDKDKNTLDLHDCFSPDPSISEIMGTRCALANGLEIAIIVSSQRVGDIEEFTAIDSHHAVSSQTMYADKLARGKNGSGEGEIR